MSTTSTLEPLARTRVAMREQGVDAVLAASPGLVAFLTGHVMPAHLAYPSRDGRLEKPTLALVTLDGAVTVGSFPTPVEGEAIAYGDDRRGLNDAGFGAVAQAARLLQLSSGRVAAELAWVPAGAARELRSAAPAVRLEPLDDLLKAAKAVKSSAELEGLRAACSLTDAAHAAIRAAVRPGVSELELYAEAVRSMNVAAGDLVISGCELQVGRRGELLMGAPTNARADPGDLVMADIYPRHPNGWWADSCSTVCCGEPDQTARSTWQALHDGLRAGAEALRPGVTAAEVYDAVARFAGEQPGHAGHGIGRDHYEEPVIAPGNADRIAEGAVIVLEPGRYGDGRGMRLEWAFLVTSDGAEPLTTFPLDL